MRKLKDEIGNFRHISQDSYWPSWKKGEDKRKLIMEVLAVNPNASIKEIAEHCGISVSQVRRHRKNLIASGLWKLCGCVIVLMSTFTAGVYYGNHELVDEWLKIHVKFPVLQLEKEILWELHHLL
jgi:hypothetical protein